MRSVLIYASSISTLIPLMVWIYWYKSLRKRGDYFFAFITTSAVVEVVGTILYARHLSNVWLFYPAIVIEFSLLALSIDQLLYSKTPRWILWSMIGAVLAVVCIDYRFVSGELNFFSLSQTVESLFLIGIGVYALSDTLQNPKEIYFQKSPLFWLATAVIVYSVGTIFVFALQNALFQHNRIAAQEVWVIQSLMNIVFNFLLVKFIACLKGPS